MNWGKSIVLAFVLFALFIGVLVTISVRQDVPLVSADYYEQELKYQEQIDRMKNTNELPEKPSIQVVNGALVVEYPGMAQITSGELELFRPSDAKLDRKYALSPDATVQRIDLSGLPGGMYKARMRWSQSGKEYFLENTIYF
ncbi:MAG: FixH family protein [Cyclobacteriaceae bacterium]|nr:FixH family protein [Cyclobacteriaceae bacterium]